MAPKKKGSKKVQEDWESELGETIDPIKQAEQEAKAAEAAQEEDENAMGGGLMAALKKNRIRKKARGVVVEEDGEGEEGDAGVAAEVDLASKAPQEATFDDEEDVFAAPSKKGKRDKVTQKQQQQQVNDDEDEDDEEGVGRVKTKKEKEKEKKEREKQRKKEQVCVSSLFSLRFANSCLW